MSQSWRGLFIVPSIDRMVKIVSLLCFSPAESVTTEQFFCGSAEQYHPVHNIVPHLPYRNKHNRQQENSIESPATSAFWTISAVLLGNLLMYRVSFKITCGSAYGDLLRHWCNNIIMYHPEKHKTVILSSILSKATSWKEKILYRIKFYTWVKKYP